MKKMSKHAVASLTWYKYTPKETKCTGEASDSAKQMSASDASDPIWGARTRGIGPAIRDSFGLQSTIIECISLEAVISGLSDSPHHV
jgi:hypothetical protein